MKKLALTLAAVAFVAFTFTSCKKEYTCCYYDGGEKITFAGYGCTTTKMSKKDKDSVESAGKTAATAAGYDDYKCE